MKYFIKSTGDEVKIGQTIGYQEVVDTPFGKMKASGRILITKENLPAFIKKGIIFKKEEQKQETKKASSEIIYYIYRVGRKLGWSPKKLAAYFGDICDKMNPSFVFQMLLKEVSEEMECNYSTKIDTVKEMYFISMVDGRIKKASKPLPNTRYVAIFRSAADAEEALSILEEFHRALFPELYGEQEDPECHS